MKTFLGIGAFFVLVICLIAFAAKSSEALFVGSGLAGVVSLLSGIVSIKVFGDKGGFIGNGLAALALGAISFVSLIVCLVLLTLGFVV